MNKSKRILLVEDNPNDANLINEFLQESDSLVFELEHVFRLASALEIIRKDHFDIILLDIGLPDSTGLNTLQSIIEIAPDLPIIVLTVNNNNQNGSDAIHEGAQDYLIKGEFNGSILVKSILYALERYKRKKSEEELKLAQSELKNLYDNLKESNDKFLNLADNIPGFISYINADTLKYEFVNEKFAKLFGIPREKIIGSHMKEIIGEANYQFALKYIDDVKLGKSISYENTFNFFSKKGWGLVNYAPVIDANGHVTSIVVLSYDITERILMEQSLKESEEMFRLLFHNSPSGIAMLSPKGTIIEINNILLDIIGAKPEEIVGKNLFELIAPNRLKFEEIENGFKEALVNKLGINELSFTSLDKRNVTIELRSAPIMGQNEVLGIIYIVNDITNRKHAEAELRKLNKAVESSGEIVFMTDKKGLFTFVNPTFTVVYGYEADEVVGKTTPRILKSGKMETKGYEDLWHSLLNRQIVNLEFINKTKDGKSIHIESSANPVFNESGDIIGFLAIQRDISENKEAEKLNEKLEGQLRQSQKMEAIGQLASGIAHDFNNLLGGIMGYAELLEMYLPKDSTLLRPPKEILSLCLKAGDLTKQLLSFARKAPIQIQNIDPNIIIRHVVRIIERTIDRRIEILVDLENQSMLISGDPNQLENAFLNIVINARDAMPGGGQLKIISGIAFLKKNIFPTEHFDIVEGSYIKISFIDSGIGMNSDTIAHIFEPFFTTKEVGSGTGLGLASVYGCIKQHNGYITVLSEEDKGTQFDIYLPLITSVLPVEKVIEEDEPITNTDKGTLLIVDDEVVYHEILTEIFNNHGYTVYCCSNGKEALEFYDKNHSVIDVIILDMNMPKMSGMDCFRGLKRINQNVKVIVTSGYGENKDFDIMKREGVLLFLQKPYKTLELIIKISELIRG